MPLSHQSLTFSKVLYLVMDNNNKKLLPKVVWENSVVRSFVHLTAGKNLKNHWSVQK